MTYKSSKFTIVLKVNYKVMNDLGFYKSLYDRELARRLDLDSALNIPIGIIAILIAIISYIIAGLSKIGKIE